MNVHHAIPLMWRDCDQVKIFSWENETIFESYRGIFGIVINYHHLLITQFYPINRFPIHFWWGPSLKSYLRVKKLGLSMVWSEQKLALRTLKRQHLFRKRAIITVFCGRDFVAIYELEMKQSHHVSVHP